MEKSRIVVLGAGFGGLELATMLSEALGDDVDVTLIDKNDAFVFGYSKLDVMFGRTTPDAVRLPYRDIAKPGVRFLQETITAIDPEARRVTTDAGVHEADVLVVALGADYDMDATPGLAEGGNEFYSVAGAERLRDAAARVLAGAGDRRRLRRAVQVPAGAERGRAAAARLPHGAGRPRRLRDLASSSRSGARCRRRRTPPRRCSPPSPSATSTFVPGRRVELARPGAPRRRARRRQRDALRPLPRRAEAPRPRRGPGERHDRGRLRARGVGDARDAVPGRVRGRRRRDRRRAEGGRVRRGRGARRRRVADRATCAAASSRRAYDGRGSCYIEFGAGRVGRVDVDFLSGPKPTGTFQEPSAALVAEKEHFGSSRRARWFGR